jgi:hypothetical protein
MKFSGHHEMSDFKVLAEFRNSTRFITEPYSRVLAKKVDCDDEDLLELGLVLRSCSRKRSLVNESTMRRWSVKTATAARLRTQDAARIIARWHSAREAENERRYGG